MGKPVVLGKGAAIVASDRSKKHQPRSWKGFRLQQVF